MPDILVHLGTSDLALLRRLSHLLEVDNNECVRLALAALNQSLIVRRLRQQTWHRRPPEKGDG
jgi:hypothetical protein